MLVSQRSFVGLLGAIRDTLEQTTSANAGAFGVPLGGPPLRAVFPSTAPSKRKQKRASKAYGKVQDYSDLVSYAEHVERRLRSR